MDTVTHTLFGIISYGMYGRRGLKLLLSFILLANLPDIDQTGYISMFTGLDIPNYGRTFGHSLLFLVLVSIVLFVLIEENRLFLMLAIQPWIHVLLLDAGTAGRIPLLYPASPTDFSYAGFLRSSLVSGFSWFDEYTLGTCMGGFLFGVGILIILFLSYATKEI